MPGIDQLRKMRVKGEEGIFHFHEWVERKNEEGDDPSQNEIGALVEDDKGYMKCFHCSLVSFIFPPRGGEPSDLSKEQVDSLREHHQRGL